MFRTLTILCALLLLAAMPVAAQWQFMGLFPPAGLAAGDTLETGAGMHGLTVTPDNRVWMHNYYSYTRDSLLVPDYVIMKAAPNADQDSIYVSRYVPVRTIHVYNADGTPAPFSPIKTVTLPGGKIDTIGFWRMPGYGAYAGIKAYRPTGITGKIVSSPNTNRGMRYGAGKVYVAIYGQIYMIDYTDGNTATKVVVDSLNSGIAPGIDADGNFYWNRVVAGNQPMKIYDNTGNFIGNAKDSLTGYSRTALAKGSTAGATDVYFADYTSHRVLQLHSDNGILGPFSVADTVLKGMDVESMEWHPKTGHLWASAGSYNDMPNRYLGTVTSYSPGGWYGYDVAAKTIEDSLIWTFLTPTAAGGEKPRAIAFSIGGDTAYVTVFGAPSTVPGVRRYRKVVTAVETIDRSIPDGYTLQQNFPNPFNPTTEIQFTMAKEGVATIVVYDMMGREIGVLLHEFVSAGTHKTTFLAEGLPSGTYLYRLYANGVTVSKKMSLVK